MNTFSLAPWRKHIAIENTIVATPAMPDIMPTIRSAIVIGLFIFLPNAKDEPDEWLAQSMRKYDM